MISPEWKTLVKLYHCGAVGERAVIDPSVDAAALISLAEEQAVIGMIALPLASAEPAVLSGSEALHLRAAAAGNNIANRRRMEAALGVVERLNAAGIHAAVLKGPSIAALYRWPECRSSADTDILISEDQENETLAFLENEGFSVEPREPGSNHSSCVHPEAGLFEVHVRLWHDDAEMIFGSFSPELEFVEDELFGHRFPTLAPNNGALFNVLHLIKHFAAERIGLRRVYDCALYLYAKRDSIDAELLQSSLRRLNGETVLYAALSVLINEGCFKPDELPLPIRCTERLAGLFEEDMALYSSKRELDFQEREELWCAYARRQTKLIGGSSLRRFTDRARKRRLEVFFPSAQKLAEDYPALNGRRLLYPVFWAHRAARGVFKKGTIIAKLFRGSESTRDLLAEGANQRAELFRELGLIE